MTTTYIPDWIIETLEEYWNDIDQAISEVLYDIGELPPDGPSALEGIAPIDDMLGCGLMGCVLPLNTENFVLKISGDITEGPIVSLIMQDSELRDHPGTVSYLAIWQIEDDEGPIYIILREAIEPLSKKQKKTKPAKTLDAYQKTSRKTYNKKTQTKFAEKIYPERIPKLRQELKKYIITRKNIIDKLYKIPETKEIADFIRAIQTKYKFMLADVHSDNVGKKTFDLDNYWTIFDVGTPGLISRVRPGFIPIRILREHAETIPVLGE
jgi:hypothetical protein